MNLNATLLGQMITFALFVLVTMRYIWPPINKVLTQRQAKIAEGLQAAERGKHDLELAQYKVAEQIRDAKIQAANIIDQAKQRASKIIEEANQRAREEGEHLIQLARDEIQQQSLKAKDELRHQTANLALLMTKKILGREVDNTANQKLLDELIAGA